jgi:RNA polymerase sigma-70 factor (ECF subfamily)
MNQDDSMAAHVSDEDLVKLTVEGDKEAFRVLFERHRQTAYRVAYRLVGSHEDALDAVQDSFVKGYRALGRFESRAKFRTWFMRIVTNACLDLRRSRTSSHVVPLVSEIIDTTSEDSQPYRHRDTPIERLEGNELHAALQSALSELSVAHRTVFVLSTEQQMTYREIADVLGIHEGTVMSRLYHARKSLQKKLSNAGVL